MAHTDTGLAALERTVQKTHEWIKEIENILECDPHYAFQSLRAVLHILRDRLPLATAIHLGDQLPMLIRGLYYENWTPTHEPRHKERSAEDFLDRLNGYFPKEAALDSEGIVRGIFQVLRAHVTEGEIHAVRAVLPAPISSLWE